jgi:hypothetical protein
MSKKDTIKSNEKDNIRERSFGAAPPVIKIQGGDMCTFGHDIREGEIWPSAATPIYPRTGYPKDHMGKSKGINPK